MTIIIAFDLQDPEPEDHGRARETLVALGFTPTVAEGRHLPASTFLGQIEATPEVVRDRVRQAFIDAGILPMRLLVAAVEACSLYDREPARLARLGAARYGAPAPW